MSTELKYMGAEEVSGWLTCPLRQSKSSGPKSALGTPVEEVLRATARMGEPVVFPRVRYDAETAQLGPLKRAQKAVLKHFDGWLDECGYTREPVTRSDTVAIDFTQGAPLRVRIVGTTDLLLRDADKRCHMVALDLDVWTGMDWRHGGKLTELAVNAWLLERGGTDREDAPLTGTLVGIPRSVNGVLRKATVPFGQLCRYGELLARQAARGARDGELRPGTHCAMCWLRECPMHW